MLGIGVGALKKKGGGCDPLTNYIIFDVGTQISSMIKKIK